MEGRPEEVKRIKGELDAILNSVLEAIEVADNEGIIRYVNPSFSRVTGISEQERIGQNIFETSPNGALARALRTHQPVYGYRTMVGGTAREVISNAAPIVVEGRMEGAVVVFQPLTDIYRLMEELKQSTSIIQDLNDKFRQISSSKYTFDSLIGSSPVLLEAVELARKVARNDSNVLLLGESGTGKEIFANAIHHASPRSDKPFIKVNCAAIPETLMESEFFGHERGAFTGAIKSKRGKFELAHGGTLFLDEIGDMPPRLQVKLLRVLQEREFERVGGTQNITCDVRVITATNRDLPAMVRQGEFREDLFYRINVMEIKLPPLRRRKEDIPAHIQHLVLKFNRRFGKRVKGVSSAAEQILLNYDWPGNARELENVIERAMVIADGDLINEQHLLHLAGQFNRLAPELASDLLTLEEAEKMLIAKALRRFGSSVEGKKQAAAALKISLATLYNKLKRYQQG